MARSALAWKNGECWQGWQVKKHEFWPREEKRHSKTSMYMANYIFMPRKHRRKSAFHCSQEHLAWVSWSWFLIDIYRGFTCTEQLNHEYLELDCHHPETTRSTYKPVIGSEIIIQSTSRHLCTRHPILALFWLARWWVMVRWDGEMVRLGPQYYWRRAITAAPYFVYIFLYFKFSEWLH